MLLARPDTRPQCAAAPHACQKCQTVADLGWKRELTGECRLEGLVTITCSSFRVAEARSRVLPATAIIELIQPFDPARFRQADRKDRPQPGHFARCREYMIT